MDNPVIASIDMISLSDSQTGVKLNTSDAFMDMPPCHRAVLIAAVMQLCAAAIEAIMNDYPDERDEIRSHLDALTLEARATVVN